MLDPCTHEIWIPADSCPSLAASIPSAGAHPMTTSRRRTSSMSPRGSMRTVRVRRTRRGEGSTSPSAGRDEDSLRRGSMGCATHRPLTSPSDTRGLLDSGAQGAPAILTSRGAGGTFRQKRESSRQPRTWARRSATSVPGTTRPLSRAHRLCREMPTLLASSSWLSSRASRNALSEVRSAGDWPTFVSR
jgi:hypothetical protein